MAVIWFFCCFKKLYQVHFHQFKTKINIILVFLFMIIIPDEIIIYNQIHENQEIILTNNLNISIKQNCREIFEEVLRKES